MISIGRIKFNRDSIFDSESGLIDINASRIDSNLQFMNFERLLYRQLWIIRQSVKLMNPNILQNTIKMFEVQLEPYIDQDTKKKIDYETEKSNELIRFYTQHISNRIFRNELVNIEKLKILYMTFEELIDVMKKNKFLFKDNMYLSLLLGHYSDLQITSIKNPQAFFNSVLMLKSILKPYIYDKFKNELNTVMNDLSKKMQYLALQSRNKFASQLRPMFINELMNYGYRILSILTVVMDKKGLLAQVQTYADLSKARFDLDKKNLNQEERLATELLQDIMDRLHKENRNWLSVMVGGTGSGKSYSALWLAKTLDPDFTIDRVAFSFKEFMDIITKKDIKSGSVIVWDEAGVDIDSRRWFSDVNVLANRILQTFRKDNLGVIFTVPDASFVDSRARTLFHAIIETKNIVRSENKVKVKWYEVHRSVQSKKDAYLWHPRYLLGGRHYRIGSVFIPKPNRELVAPYEKKKGTFTDNLKSNVKAELKDKQSTLTKKKTRAELRKIMREVLKGDEKVYAKVRNGMYNFSADMLRFKFSLTTSDSKKLKYMLEEFLNK